MRTRVYALLTALLAASSCDSGSAVDSPPITVTENVAKLMAAAPATEAAASGLTCLNNWRTSGACGQWCLRETQEDRKHCTVFLDCYYRNNCGPSTCGAPDAVCGVNKFSWGMAPKIIADQVYQCLGCPGSTPVTFCAGLPDTTPCTDRNACTSGERCRANSCTGGTLKECKALDQCHLVGNCDTRTGDCSNPVAPPGTTCNDGNSCTSPDTCDFGVCKGTVLLGPPSGLVASAGSAQIELTWTAAVGATGYTIKRAVTSGGPYTSVGTSSAPSFLDTNLPIGPTYYYVVVATAACGESAPSNEASAAPTSDKTGTFPPGPGPCKPAVTATSLSAQALAFQSRADLKPPLADLNVRPATVSPQRKISFAAKAAESGRSYLYTQYDLTMRDGVHVVTPTFARRLQGTFVPKPARSERILVVASDGKTTSFVAAIPDPRIVHPGYNSLMSVASEMRILPGGMLRLTLPEIFLSEDVLKQTTFSFYAMSPSVPARAPVTIDGLPVLAAGAQLLATSSGSALVPLLSAGNK